MLFDIAQKIILRMDAEHAHDTALSILKRSANTPVANLYRQSLSPKPIELMGLYFPNPVGLAAGLDKDGQAIDAFHAMGFGHVEVGTVTPRPQPGNPPPRLFRIEEKKAIINRMGFNNLGVNNLKTNLLAKKSSILVGINIGKNKDTPIEQGKDDYLICMEHLYDVADYITVNISSPNTPGLRSLQYGEQLNELLSHLKDKQSELSNKYDKYVPLSLKISPDLSEDEIASVASSLLQWKFDSVIATNTTLDRDFLPNHPHSRESGGLSGAPLMEKATKVVKALKSHLEDEIPIIAAGGIMSASDAAEKFSAGAKLVQIYSGFIYHGPKLIKQINDCYEPACSLRPG